MLFLAKSIILVGKTKQILLFLKQQQNYALIIDGFKPSMRSDNSCSTIFYTMANADITKFTSIKLHSLYCIISIIINNIGFL